MLEQKTERCEPSAPRTTVAGVDSCDANPKRPSSGQPFVRMAAQTAVSEQRLDWMLATLLEKITERGGSVSNRVKTLLTRFDLDNSGELEMDEFRSCLEDFLAGLQVRARRPVRVVSGKEGRGWSRFRFSMLRAGLRVRSSSSKVRQ